MMSGALKLLDLTHLMKWRSQLPNRSIIRLFISCLNFDDRNFLSLWFWLFLLISSPLSSNSCVRLGRLDDLTAFFISSRTRSLFLSRKPITAYSMSLGEWRMRKRVEGRLKLAVGKAGCFLCLCLSLVMKEESSGDATEHHSSSRLNMLSCS